MNVLIRQYVASRITTSAALAEAIGEICGGFVEERHSYFGFETGEKWNFAAYLWNPQTNRLEQAWRKKSNNHPSGPVGRSWGDNEGHIGHAFHNKQELITTDSQAPEVAAFVAAVNNSRPYDAATYRSYISEPILAADPTALPHGVLVATSDKVGRYDPANARVLKHTAVAIATLLEAAYDSH